MSTLKTDWQSYSLQLSGSAIHSLLAVEVDFQVMSQMHQGHIPIGVSSRHMYSAGLGGVLS